MDAAKKVRIFEKAGYRNSDSDIGPESDHHTRRASTPLSFFRLMWFARQGRFS